MNTYEFTLKFALPETSSQPQDYIERLAQAGCDDALIGIGQTGRLALEFDREATNALEAVSSAIADVKEAIPGATLIEATPDLVGLSDIAEILGCSRQYTRKLMINSGAEFPAPLHDGKTAIWRLSNMLVWLRDHKKYPLNEQLVELAYTNMQINIAREAQEIDPRILALHQ